MFFFLCHSVECCVTVECTGVLVILSLLFLTPWFNYIPDASLAAVIISAVYDLIDFTLLPKLWRVNSTYIIRQSHMLCILSPAMSLNWFVQIPSLHRGVPVPIRVDVWRVLAVPSTHRLLVTHSQNTVVQCGQEPVTQALDHG